MHSMCSLHYLLRVSDNHQHSDVSLHIHTHLTTFAQQVFDFVCLTACIFCFLGKCVLVFLQAIGCSFSVHIVASIYSLIAALAAAKRRDIPTHRRHVIRMLGLAYGIFPTKYIWVGVLAISNVVSGTWAYATAIALSAITGVVVTDWAFGEHISPKDMAYDRSKGTLDARHIKDA